MLVLLLLCFIVPIIAVCCYYKCMTCYFKHCYGEKNNAAPEFPQSSTNRETRMATNQTTDIWNISGRVNHQDGPVTSEPNRWPTHDHHVSIDSFVVPGNLQSQKKDRVPPPPYSEVDLPTYEQATGVPKPKTDLTPVHATPSSSRNFEQARS